MWAGRLFAVWSRNDEVSYDLQQYLGPSDPKSSRRLRGKRPTRRRADIDDIFTEDSVFRGPQSGAHRGRDEIDRAAGAIKATHPDFRYQPIAEPEELGNSGRVRWVAGRPAETPA
jgi:hypothetical protein